MKVIGVGEACWSQSPTEHLRTYALGSCVGMTAYDPLHRIGGIIHLQLPKGSGADVQQHPFRYAHVGIAKWLNELIAAGAERRLLQLTLCGGAQMYEDKAKLGIGMKNLHATQQLLKKNHLKVVACDTGGHEARTLTLWMSDGRVEVHRQGRVHQLWANPIPFPDSNFSCGELLR